MIRRWRSGETSKDIAEGLGFDIRPVAQLVDRLRRHGEPVPYRRPRRTAPRSFEGIAD